MSAPGQKQVRNRSARGVWQGVFCHSCAEGASISTSGYATPVIDTAEPLTLTVLNEQFGETFAARLGECGEMK